jgi:hypothetical protein
VFPADPEAHTIRVAVIVGSDKNPRDWRGSFVPRSQGKTYRFGGVIFATKLPSGLYDCLARSPYSAPIFCDSVTNVS